MKRRVVLVLVLLLVLISMSTQASMKLRYAHPNAPDTIVGRFASGLAELVYQRTDGRIEIDVFPSSQLGSVDEMIEGSSVGAIEMGHNDFAALAMLFDDMALFNVPYIFESPEHAAIVTDSATSEILQELNTSLIAQGNLRVLGSLYYGYRHLTINDPIYSPQDLRGKRVRAIPLKIWLSMVEGMGATPTPVDFAELPTALATGVVDGQENPLTTIYNHHFYETQDYLILTGHMMAFLACYINDNVWNRISSEDQEIIIEAVNEMKARSIAWGLEEEEEDLQRLKDAGMTVIGVEDGLDMDAFVSSVNQQIIEDFPQWEEYINTIREMAP